MADVLSQSEVESLLAALDSGGSARPKVAPVPRAVPALSPQIKSYNEMFEYARGEILRRGLARAGDRVLVTAGVPFDVPGTTNLMKVEVV